MTKIRVDFNRRGRDGLVIGSIKRAEGELAVGDVVEAYQPDDDLSFGATVVEVDDRGRVFLDMKWEREAPVVRSAARSWTDLYQLRIVPARGITAPAGNMGRRAVPGNLTTA